MGIPFVWRENKSSAPRCKLHAHATCTRAARPCRLRLTLGNPGGKFVQVTRLEARTGVARGAPGSCARAARSGARSRARRSCLRRFREASRARCCWAGLAHHEAAAPLCVEQRREHRLGVEARQAAPGHLAGVGDAHRVLAVADQSEDCDGISFAGGKRGRVCPMRKFRSRLVCR